MTRADDCGTYALILRLPSARTIRVGSLGALRFPRGCYVYVGSAMNGLEARLARHHRQEKKLFWHVDYFLRHAHIAAVATRVSRRRLECRAARALAARPHAQIVAPRFGSSDCRCPTHLIYFSKRPCGIL